MSNELSVPQVSLPSAVVADDAAFNDMARSGNFLGRLQLYTKGKAINQRLIGPGEYGIPEGDDKITVLGDKVDVIPLARRLKALDMSDKDDIVTNYDPNSDTFKDIMARSEQPDSGCMYGISFLFWIPVIARFVEYFAGTKTARGEAGKLYPFLPTADHGARVVTIGSRLCEKGNYSWHAPTVAETSNPPAALPTAEQMEKELKRFVNPKADESEKVSQEEVAGRRKR
ncbi:MAG: hypothetical protein ACTHK7_12020 [Aureliella sp.]